MKLHLDQDEITKLKETGSIDFQTDDFAGYGLPIGVGIKTLYPTQPTQPTQSFPEVHQQDVQKAKHYLDHYQSEPCNTISDYVRKIKALHGIPFSAFVGQTGIHQFDSKQNYMSNSGWFGQITEWLIDNRLPNNDSGPDHPTLGEMKTQTVILDTNLQHTQHTRHLEICTVQNTQNWNWENWETSGVYNKIKKGINVFGLVPFKHSRTILCLHRLETNNPNNPSEPSEFLNQCKSDFEIGRLNPHNQFLRFSTKNSGTTPTIIIPKDTLNKFKKEIIVLSVLS